jgi:hypothetical protein
MAMSACSISRSAGVPSGVDGHADAAGDEELLALQQHRLRHRAHDALGTMSSDSGWSS